jgi:hypothetical protein
MKTVSDDGKGASFASVHCAIVLRCAMSVLKRATNLAESTYGIIAIDIFPVLSHSNDSIPAQSQVVRE